MNLFAKKKFFYFFRFDFLYFQGCNSIFEIFLKFETNSMQEVFEIFKIRVLFSLTGICWAGNRSNCQTNLTFLPLNEYTVTALLNTWMEYNLEISSVFSWIATNDFFLCFHSHSALSWILWRSTHTRLNNNELFFIQFISL